MAETALDQVKALTTKLSFDFNLDFSLNQSYNFNLVCNESTEIKCGAYGYVFEFIIRWMLVGLYIETDI